MSTINPLPTGSPAFMADLTQFLREEDADRMVEGWVSYVWQGGLHGPGAGLTGTPSPMIAYPNGKRITESGSITYANNAISWVICDEFTTGNRGSYIRVPGTHYLVRTALTPEPWTADTILLMQVTTAGGAITDVKDHRQLSPTNTLHTRGIAFSHAYPSLQAAIDALPDEGGTVFIVPGNYVLTETLRLGNGTASQVSTRQGIQLVGLGQPYNSGFGYTNLPPVHITWAGGAAPMIEVRGPLSGWGLKNLALNGLDVATHGVRIVSAQFGVMTDCMVIGATRAAVGTDTVTTFGGAANTTVLHNRFSNVFLGSTGLYCMELNGSTPTAGTGYNTFDNILLVVNGNGIGLQLGMAHSNVFTNLHISLSAGAAAPINLAYDNGHDNKYPGGNIFFGVETHNKPMTQTGAANAGLIPNQLFGVLTSGLSAGFAPEIEGIIVYSTDTDGNLLLLPSINAAAAKPNGDVGIVSTANHVHNLVPSITKVADCGAASRQWRLGWFAGGIITDATVLSAGPVALSELHGTVPVNAAGGAITLQLPALAAVPGKIYVIKKVDASGNAVNVVPAGAEAIDGVGGAMAITTQWQTRTIQAAPGGWIRLDRP